MTSTNVLRTRSEGCWSVQENSWGRFLSPANDPLADTVITSEQLEGFELKENTPRIPAILWNRWINLCFELTRRDKRNLEVSCRLLRNDADPSQYRIVVPEQKVTVVSVRVDSFDKAIDITTGEVISQWPPEGWSPCGSSHSHNTMDSFFSGTDDQFELGDPGLHIVVGNIDITQGTYTLKASITANKRRFIIDDDLVVDKDAPGEYDFHSSVIDIISLPGQAKTKPLSSGYWNSSYSTLDAEWANYNTIYSSTNNSSRNTDQFQVVNNEMNGVLAVVDDLIKACELEGVSTSEALLDLSVTLEEMAFDIQRSELVLTNEDPFFWSSY